MEILSSAIIAGTATILANILTSYIKGFQKKKKEAGTIEVRLGEYKITIDVGDAHDPEEISRNIQESLNKID